MVNETIVLVILIILILFKLYFTSKESVTFSEKYLIKEYKNQNIQYHSKNQTLKKDGKILSTETNLNDINSIDLCNSKSDTSKLLQNYNIPVPKFVIWDSSISRENNIREINKLKFPLVVKPNNGSYGNNVFLNLNNINQVLDKIDYLLNINKKIIIEEQVDGENYRIMVLNNNIIDIIHRNKPTIIGDNKHTIKELINNYNTIQRKNKEHSIKNIDYSLIDTQGLNLESIPIKGQKIIISNVCNYHNGSKLTRIPIQNVHPDNLEMFKKINKAMNLNLSGIDYMSPNIIKSYKQNNGHINEVNGRPHFDIHHNYDSKNNNTFAVKRFVTNLFT
jgi:cyanophycin synthetase